MRRRWHPVWLLVHFFKSGPSSFWVRLLGPFLMGIAFNKALYIVTPYYLNHIPAWVKVADFFVCILSVYMVSRHVAGHRLR